MKRIISLFLTILFLMAFMPSATAVETNGLSVVMAINKDVAFVDGVQTVSTAPILVFDKTYVDLYAVAPSLKIKVEWINSDINVNVNGMVQKFTRLSQWEELKTQPYKYFVKDSKTFVSLREIIDMAGVNLTYNNGIITIGNQVEFDRNVYADISVYDFNDYIFEKYPVAPAYTVYPYQEYSYEMMLNDANTLKRMYPDLIKTSTIGQSVEGRDLLLIEFGRGDTKIFVCGTHHAREYITTTYIMYAIDRYAYAYRTGSMWGKYNPKDILDNVTFCIVPMVNPDGVNLVQNGVNATKNPQEVASMGIYESPQYGYKAWKANIRGVDLNWNYDKGWWPKSNRNPRGNAGFFGEYPNSEPEVVAICNYVDTHPFEAYLSYHTQGEIIYYVDDKANPSGIDDALYRDTRYPLYGDSASGDGGSFYDYVFFNYRKPTITVELCPYVGNYPYPDENFDRVWNPTKNIMLIVANEILYEKYSKQK